MEDPTRKKSRRKHHQTSMRCCAMRNSALREAGRYWIRLATLLPYPEYSRRRPVALCPTLSDGLPFSGIDFYRNFISSTIQYAISAIIRKSSININSPFGPPCFTYRGHLFPPFDSRQKEGGFNSQFSNPDHPPAGSRSGYTDL